jgi:hypothetical protein
VADLPVVPSQGFDALLKVFKSVTTKDYADEVSLYWHMGNALDTIITYFVQANKRDTDFIIGESFDLYNVNVGSGPKPGWWRDDYGWWGIAFLNAAQEDHENILKLGGDTQKAFFKAAKDCWDIMNYDWVHHRKDDGSPLGVRNTDEPGGETNTITNVLFLVLSLRLYETKNDTAALKTAGEVFDWFYTAPRPTPPPGGQDQDSGLFNPNRWVRYKPSDYMARAWSADQGWFWRACLLLLKFETDPGRLTRVVFAMDQLKIGLFATGTGLFGADGILREGSSRANFDYNFSVGPGVFMRQFALINVPKNNQWSDLIVKSAKGAWQNSGWENDLPTGCWYPNTNDCVYDPYRVDSKVWKLALKTSAQDAFNAYMTVPSA